MLERFLLNLYERITDIEIPAKSFDEMIKEEEINPNEYFISVPILKKHIDNIKFLLEEEQRAKQIQEEMKKPVKKFLYIEDGSVDTDTLINELAITNPEIRVIVYRQGADKPEFLDLGE